MGKVVKDNKCLEPLDLTEIEDEMAQLRTDVEGEMSALQTTIEGEMDTLQDTVNGQLATMQGQVDSATSIANKATVSGDFIVETKSGSMEIQSGSPWDYDNNGSWNIAKTGYMPLAIAGFKLQYNNGSNAVAIEKLRVNGNFVAFRCRNTTSEGVQYITLYVDVLYVKVK